MSIALQAWSAAFGWVCTFSPVAITDLFTWVLALVFVGCAAAATRMDPVRLRGVPGWLMWWGLLGTLCSAAAASSLDHSAHVTPAVPAMVRASVASSAYGLGASLLLRAWLQGLAFQRRSRSGDATPCSVRGADGFPLEVRRDQLLWFQLLRRIDDKLNALGRLEHLERSRSRDGPGDLDAIRRSLQTIAHTLHLAVDDERHRRP